MRLSIEEVRHIALLARVAMTDEELERMRDEMANILEHFDVLQQVDTEGVEPTAHSADVRSAMRDDEVRPSATIEDVLSNAPLCEEDFLRVWAVLE
jgi:aspartyl-tRNA(Asn)/glutamyl-tRNA(Gln) amidotransferase subunit C